MIRDKKILEENFERKVLGIVSRFSTEKSFKTWEGTCFSEKNTSIELNIFFVDKIEEDFLQ